jgi:tetratricopeptide (TPR) repeat protein
MRGTLATTVLALALAAGAAHAQAPNPAADAALAEGRRLYDLQEWDKAIAKFKEAYALREDAAALFNIAQSYRLKGDCAQAASFYKTFKRKFPKEKPVDKFITEMEACAKAKPTTDPTTNPTNPTTNPTNPTTNPTNPTNPTTNPTNPTTNPTNPTTNPTTDPSVAPTTPPINVIEPVDKPGGNGLRIASYVTMGAGGAGLIVGVVFGVKARQAANEAEALRMGDEWNPSIEERGRRNQKTATISLVAGGVLAAGGVAMFLLSRPSSESSGVSLAPTADGAQLVWAGSF